MSHRFLPLVLLAATACGPQSDLAVEEQAIREVSATWMELDGQKDAEGVAALFAEDGAVYWEQRQPVIGHEAIAAHMEQSYAENPSGEGGFGPDRVDVAMSGDLAVEQGAYQNPADQGRYITVHKKVGGAWQILADMSLSTALDGGAPDWAVESLATWYVAFNARDTATLLDLYTSDARVGGVDGRGAIIASFESGWAEADETCSGAFDGFEIVDDIAAGWGRDFCTAPDGTLSTISRWMSVHERQSDGSWLMIRDRGEPIE